MQVQITIPDDFVVPLRATHGDDLGRAALEMLVLDSYRVGKLSAFQVQSLLHFADRFETQKWLGQHGAHESYALGDLDADRDALDRILR